MLALCTEHREIRIERVDCIENGLVCASVEQLASGRHPELRREALRALVQGLLGSSAQRFGFALKRGGKELLEQLLWGQNVN